MTDVTRRTVLVTGAAGLTVGGVAGWRWLTRPDPADQSSSPVSSAPVVRTDLTAREQVPGIMGYAGDWQISHAGPGGVLTAAPRPATIVRQGQRLYEVDGRPVHLLHGTRPAWRDFVLGMEPGEDVRQLERSLAVLGFGPLTADGRFSGATTAAVRRWQVRLGQPATGRLPLGTVAFAPDAVRVVEVLAAVGQRVDGSAVLRASSTRRVVTVALPTSRQGQVRVGGPTEVTLPDGQRVPGRVAEVGRVAVGGDSTGGSGGGPAAPATIAVVVTLDQPDAAEGLDQAQVQVAVTTATRTDVLAVPVTALMAAGTPGGYEVVIVNGSARRAVPVRPGLFDKRAGLIEVTGGPLVEGMRVQVPHR